jgi:hypothetical protein
MRKIDDETTTLSDFSYNTPITNITVKYNNEKYISFDGPEETILNDFCKYVIDEDTYILVCVTRDKV